jgi:hypothetical protein
VTLATDTHTTTLDRETLALDEEGDQELVLQDVYYQQGFTDGLPIIIPTVERVENLIRQSGFDRDREIGAIPPSGGVATVANVAVNAVMAGARPEHMGIILASLEAMLKLPFNLAGLQVTTNPVGPLTIVSGPIRHRLGIDSSGHAYSGGNNTNGPIGRAIRLALRNLGEAKGDVDRATLGLPSKYSFCVAENEEASPWEPLHVSLGFNASDDVVTVVAPESIIDTCRPTFSSSAPVVWDFGELMKSVGTNRNTSRGTLLWIIPPALARVFAADGYTRQSLQERLYEEAKFEWGQWGNWEFLHGDGRHLEVDGKVVITRSPSDIYIMVAGRDDPLHASYLPSVMISLAQCSVVWRP